MNLQTGKSKTLKILLNIFIILVCFISLAAVSCPYEIEPSIDIPSYDAIALFNLPGFGIGVNIGNTLDSIGTNSWLAGETGWGNPPITRDFVRALKNHGYKTIRLPVTWAENIGPAPSYTIRPAFMSRVEEVVNWILAEDMFCILNIHHDGGHSDKSWILNMSTNETATLNMFNIVWTQIAERFKNASDKFIFPVYKAIPSWTSQPRAAISSISAVVETPPATVTWQETASRSLRTGSRSIPVMVPSRSTQVKSNSEA